MSVQHWVVVTLLLAACGVWQVQQWLQAGLVRFHAWFERRYIGEREVILSPIAAARLEEAEWWEHLAPNCAKDENDTAEYTEDCMYCQRIAALKSEVAVAGPEGNSRA